MTKGKSDSGFGLVEGLLILVVVGILGFTGWFVWHSKQTADKTLVVNSTAPSFKKQTKTTTSAPTANSSTAHDTTSSTQQGLNTTPAADYATSIQILSISDSNDITFQLNGLANTNNYYQNWTASSSNLTGHIAFTASQAAPDSILTTTFKDYSFSTPTTYSVSICENGGQSICSNPYQVSRTANQ
jgi:cytoskeletal protein RodZ